MSMWTLMPEVEVPGTMPDEVIALSLPFIFVPRMKTRNFFEFSGIWSGHE